YASDWSSDVCSSDLEGVRLGVRAAAGRGQRQTGAVLGGPGGRRGRAEIGACGAAIGIGEDVAHTSAPLPKEAASIMERPMVRRRSEERRVGKEWRAG